MLHPNKCLRLAHSPAHVPQDVTESAQHFLCGDRIRYTRLRSCFEELLHTFLGWGRLSSEHVDHNAQLAGPWLRLHFWRHHTLARVIQVLARGLQRTELWNVEQRQKRMKQDILQHRLLKQ